ncbi:Sas10 C-terminal domain-containing protein [Xylariomycetidae sp. FL0641]|nr:Sas10 C-terminal domain-containing protein [Xylariomycetidae sp. FL0641]
MARKRKASSGHSQPKGPREYNPSDAKLGPVTTYEDLADDQDRHFLEQDEILFDEGPKSKRQKAQEDEDALYENSDEEIMRYDQDDSDDDDEDDYQEIPRKPSKSAKRKGAADDEPEDDDEEGDTGYWGASKQDYYNADQIETTVDAEEEEKEALRLQKKKLAKMSEDDFFNEDEWLAPEAEGTEQDDVVTEVLKDVEIPTDMGSDERYKLLQARYPELPFLADELHQLQPLLVELQKEAEDQGSRNLKVIRYRILGCYVATLAMYFATLTSPSRDGDGTAKTLEPAELRDHEVMGTLLECRDAWKKVEHLKAKETALPADGLLSPPEEEPAAVGDEEETTPKASTVSSKEKKAKAKAEKKAKAIEDSLADLDSLLTTKNKKKARKVKPDVADQDGNSDFGEEETLDTRAAADKAARKKSLRFYTSQIAQKANRRADAGRDAGGDLDIPYRERLKDRQARLNAEAERRGQKGSKRGADLGDDSDGDDEQVANVLRNNEDEYYDMIASASGKRKDEKAARAAAHAAASTADRVVENEELGEDGKRKITWTIEKNKGLAPKRKKENRNPRAKKRKQYDTKQKKLASMKAVYKGGQGGAYRGEQTGIKPGLIKSVKLGS